MKNNGKMLVSAVIFMIGAISGGIFSKKLLSELEIISAGRSSGEKTVLLLAFLISLFVSLLLALIIHEGGHLVCGLLSGYKYLLFRVGSLTLIRRNNKFEFKKFSIKGTGGQCILMPPESAEPLKVPCLLYHAGGGLFNLLTALIAIPMAFAAESIILKVFL